MATIQRISDLGDTWVQAELAGDVAALDGLGAEGFRLVGPLGFVLDREQWLARYRGDRALRLVDIQWDEAQAREFGTDLVIVIGIQTQRGTYAGQPADGRFRVTQVWVRNDQEWKLAGLHYCAITPPGRTSAP